MISTARDSSEITPILKLQKLRETHLLFLKAVDPMASVRFSRENALTHFFLPFFGFPQKTSDAEVQAGFRSIIIVQIFSTICDPALKDHLGH